MWTSRLCLLLLVAAVAQSNAFPRTKRQAELEEGENPSSINEEATVDGFDRDKRMLEGATQAKYGVKNALLGFVFGKINQLIDSKTRFINQLDKQNIEKNKMYGIESPGSPTAALGNALSSFIGPKINLISGALGSLSGGSSSGGGSGGGLGSLLSIFTGLSSSSSGRGGGSLTVSDSDSSDSTDDDDDDDDDKQ